ncbi:hypothetical protein [Caulobacter sp. RL271]|uniref:Uncharacterized protein n=1 Tax=Caulobacter segnis TaxID=88688 RepID=A0ABY4ZWG0_9CAUL|nr:hypothetical protein [Caulobacter segnis]USQ96327.1 hypothetical protein MZV50_01650 [Caulobacter segnis]
MDQDTSRRTRKPRVCEPLEPGAGGAIYGCVSVRDCRFTTQTAAAIGLALPTPGASHPPQPTKSSFETIALNKG